MYCLKSYTFYNFQTPDDISNVKEIENREPQQSSKHSYHSKGAENSDKQLRNKQGDEDFGKGTDKRSGVKIKGRKIVVSIITAKVKQEL